jgi:hypothetical protein
MIWANKESEFATQNSFYKFIPVERNEDEWGTAFHLAITVLHHDIRVKRVDHERGENVWKGYPTKVLGDLICSDPEWYV